MVYCQHPDYGGVFALDRSHSHPVWCYRCATPLCPAAWLHHRHRASLHDDLRGDQFHDSGGRRPQYAMLSMVIGAIINVILDPVLIFVFHMGVQGAAVATIIGQVASFVVSVVYMPRFKTVHLNASAFSPRAKTCGNTVSGMILLNSA